MFLNFLYHSPSSVDVSEYEHQACLIVYTSNQISCMIFSVLSDTFLKRLQYLFSSGQTTHMIEHFYSESASNPGFLFFF